MNTNLEKFQQKVQPIAIKMSENRYLKSIMAGMMAALPALVIGSIAALLRQLPIMPYQNFITSFGIDQLLQLPVTFTTNFLAVIFLITISYSLADSFEVKGLTPAIIALVSFFILTPIETVINEFGQTSAIISMEWLGSAGIFSAIFVAIVSTRLYVYVTRSGWTIKMPESVPPFIKDSFTSLIPGIIIVSLFTILSGLFSSTSFGSLHQFVYGIIQVPMQQLGGSVWALLIVSLIGQVLWFFGIHGSMVVFSVMVPIWSAMDAAQLSAYSAGEPLPNIVGLNFFMAFTFGGTVLGLAILMLFAKSEKYKMLGKLSLVPAMFGITEPVIFGTPLIFNPIFAIPFIFGNILSLILAYVVTIIGIIPPLTGIGAPAGLPVIIQGLIMGGWRVALFQGVLVVLWIILWYPFFKVSDRIALREEQTTNM